MGPFAIAVLVVVAAAAIYIFYKIWYTKRNGIETEAIITRIEEESDIDANVTYHYFVQYAMNGQKVEARLTNPGFGKGLEVGARITIRYLEEKPNAAVWVKESIR